MTSIPLGAINKKTGRYSYPKIATKTDEYCCPDCNKELILCKGEIRIPYFRHKSDTSIPCNYYNNPTESQIHKDAKQALKIVLENKIPMTMFRICSICNGKEIFEIPQLDNTSKIILEYPFQYNSLRKVADVAYLDNGELMCIFEICYKHKTCNEDRPEPWFELDALELINSLNDDNFENVEIQCIRRENCETCIENENRLREENKQQKIMSIRNLNKSKLPILEKQLEVEIENDTSLYYTSSLLLNLREQVRNIKDELEIKMLENNILYNNKDNIKIEITHPNKNEKITLHSISSYSMIEILDWYNSVSNKFNIIDCSFKVENLIGNIWQSVKDKNICELNSLVLKLDEHINMCLKHKYKNYAYRFAIARNKMLDLEIDLVKNNIQYSKQDTAGKPIYIITLPNTKEVIKFAISSGKIYKNKKWHTSREIGLYDLLNL
jgi:hypothetical protein